MRRLPKHRQEEARRVARADRDIRYVPSEGPVDFAGLAHETRYRWLLDHGRLEGQTVLDLGCGSGYGAFLLAEKAAQVYGVDFSGQAVAFAREFYRRDNVQFLQLDASSPEGLAQLAALGPYDTIISFDVIEHIERYFDYLENVCRLLGANGEFWVSTPNRLETFQWNRAWNPCHVQEFSPYQLRRLLGLYFREVRLGAQDFRDVARREMVRSWETRDKGAGSWRTARKLWRSIRKRIAPGSGGPVCGLDYADIVFAWEPEETILHRAFGLMAVCRTPRQAESGSSGPPG